MMHSINAALAGLFSLTGLLAFLAGFCADRLVRTFICRWWNRRHPDQPPKTVKFKGLYMLWALIFVFIGYIGVQQNQTSEHLQVLAKSTGECQDKLIKQLKARAQISDDMDNWSAIQRKALNDWLHEILFPPPDIAARRAEDPKDPRVQQWGLDVTTKYSDIIEEAERAQDASLAQRAAHPLPDVSCAP